MTAIDIRADEILREATAKLVNDAPVDELVFEVQKALSFRCAVLEAKIAEMKGENGNL